ncbi:MAG TPA: band-7 C-terminal domain-containing protein, partial [Casimicrobiaceae bacterium]|nr:band-7 C-terminal domain-containing protein [Casimicrobiaceae bacterium]
IRKVAQAISEPGGINAVNMKIAEEYIGAFGNLAKTNNTLIIPSNLSDMAGLVATVTTMLKTQPAAGGRA